MPSPVANWRRCISGDPGWLTPIGLRVGAPPTLPAMQSAHHSRGDDNLPNQPCRTPRNWDAAIRTRRLYSPTLGADASRAAKA
jgi:hypothetical protein